MNNILQTEKITCKDIAKLIPNVDGVIPSGSSEKVIRKEFQKRDSLQNDKIKNVYSQLESIFKAAEVVGLDLTANDASRLVRDVLEGSKNGSLSFPSMYKGVSFNPKTYDQSRGRGEWIVLLDFFSLMRSFVNETTVMNQENPKFLILDAGLYWIINLLGIEGIKLKNQTPRGAASELLETIKTSLQKTEFKEIVECNRIRNAYLRAIAQQFPANMAPQVLSLKDIWYDDSFTQFLSKAIELFCTRGIKGWKVSRPVFYQRYMPYSPWVTPLVAAEQIFVGQRFGFSGILSPTAESGWNKAIDQFSRYMNTKTYIAWMYSRKIGKKLSYEWVPFFSDSEDKLRSKMQMAQTVDPSANELVIKFVTPFVEPEMIANMNDALKKRNLKKLSEFVFNFMNRIEKQACEFLDSEKDIPLTPLNQIGWLTNFPPGIC